MRGVIGTWKTMPMAGAGVKRGGTVLLGTLVPHSGYRQSLYPLTLPTSMATIPVFAQVKAVSTERGRVGGVGIGDGATDSCPTEASQEGPTSGEIAAVPRAALAAAFRQWSGRSNVETTTEAMS